MAAATSAIKRIAITSGEPAGIGPDLCLQLAQHALPCQLIIIGNPELLAQRAKQLNQTVKLNSFDAQSARKPQAEGNLTIIPFDLVAPVHAGQLNPANSDYVLKTISAATQGCLDGLFDGMVTAPVHKAVINQAGFAFSGHTEYIAEITGGHPVMMLETPGLRVALVTIHLPLSQVPLAITAQRLRTVIAVLHQDLTTRFDIGNPKILVCGLNPHAGESGHLGREEIDIIDPVLNEFRNQGMDIGNTLPADTLFTPKYLDSADAVLTMYHDQGLPVLKHMGFGHAVNITLGLPIIRTSVDHGTALELAGTGKANPGSMQYALQTALMMANNQK